MVNGYRLWEVIGSFDIYALVEWLISIIRILISLLFLEYNFSRIFQSTNGSINGCKKTNFLNGDLDEKIYMEQLEDFYHGRSWKESLWID